MPDTVLGLTGIKRMWSLAQGGHSLAGETSTLLVTPAQMEENNFAQQRVKGVAGKAKRRQNTWIRY